MLRGVLALLFPGSCLGCGRARAPWCSTCGGQLVSLTPPGCGRCGRPLEAPATACADCPPPPIGWCRSAFLYDGPVRRALFRLKFAGLRSVAEAMAPSMVEALARSPPPGPPLDESVITWVPLGRRRRRSRGYDQSEALARAVAALTGWRVASLVEREIETSPQAKRSGPERRRALAGAFWACPRPPERVVLVDDVITTGATAADCARALLEAGAGHVGVLTAARSMGSPIPARCYNSAGFRPGSVVARENLFR